MKYTVVALPFLLSVMEPVQGSYLTDLAQLFSKLRDSPIAEDEEPLLANSTTPSAPPAPPAEDASSTAKSEEEKAKAKKAETAEGKAEAKALKSVNSTKVNEDDIEAAKTALKDTEFEQSQKLEDALKAMNETTASIDTLSGDNNYTVPEFMSNMTLSKWNLFNTTDQLQRYRDVVYQKNQL